jgi:hypothetical protein
MKHTPAPWTLHDARSTRVDLINDAKGHAVGEIVWVDVRNPADAALIAAAPDMLALLYKALPFIEDAADDPCYKPHVVKDLERAIKALLTLIDQG